MFLNADPAQSVELGISMRKGTINDVLHSHIFDKHNQVKDNLQEIMLQTNHREFGLGVYYYCIKNTHMICTYNIYTL